MATNVGANDGDGKVGTSDKTATDYEYYSGWHGYHNTDAFEAAYNEINKSVGRNRIHQQSYFNKEPYNPCEGARTGNFRVSVNYKVEKSATAGDEYYFEHPDPVESEVEGGGDYISPSLDVEIDVAPYISLGLASVSINPESGGNFVGKNYEYFEWDMALPPGDGTDLPTEQDPSAGVRCDVAVNAAEIGDMKSVFPDTTYTYEQVCGTDGSDYYTTERVYLGGSLEVV